MTELSRPGRKPVKQCTHSEWRAAVARLQACCPPPEGYAWRFTWTSRVDESHSKGESYRKPGKDEQKGQCVIKVLKGLSESETVDVLMHEMAHSFDMWTHHSWATPHADTFWIWLGRIYRRYWEE